MVSHAPPGEGVLTVRVWHEDGGGFRARILRGRAVGDQPDSVVVCTRSAAIDAVGDWLDELIVDRARS